MLSFFKLKSEKSKSKLVGNEMLSIYLKNCDIDKVHFKTKVLREKYGGFCVDVKLITIFYNSCCY